MAAYKVKNKLVTFWIEKVFVFRCHESDCFIKLSVNLKSTQLAYLGTYFTIFLTLFGWKRAYILCFRCFGFGRWSCSESLELWGTFWCLFIIFAQDNLLSRNFVREIFTVSSCGTLVWYRFSEILFVHITWSTFRALVCMFWIKVTLRHRIILLLFVHLRIFLFDHQGALIFVMGPRFERQFLSHWLIACAIWIRWSLAVDRVSLNFWKLAQSILRCFTSIEIQSALY